MRVYRWAEAVGLSVPGDGIDGRPRPAWWSVRAAVFLFVLVPAACAGAPEPIVPAPTPPPRVVVVEDPEATVLTAAVVVPGSAWELPGTEGLTMLSAMTVLEAVRPALDSLGARVSVRCSAAAFTFTLLAARTAWEAALPVFLDGLFRPDPDREALGRARSRLGESLTLDQASPAWQAHLAVRRALHGDSLSSGWLGPACGVPEALPLFDLTDVRVGALRFGPALAHIAALAPTDPGELNALLRRRIPAGPKPVIPSPRAVRPGRRYVERNTVTAWLAVAFPFGPDADIEAVRLLGAVLEDAIAPGVDRPESFTASHSVERHGAGGTLVVRAGTTPTAAAAYADRIEAIATRAAYPVGVPAPVLRRVARRHRGDRLLALAMPEARAAGMALELALGGTPTPWPNPAVTAARLRAAAAALGDPARSVVGPRAARGAVLP